MSRITIGSLTNTGALGQNVYFAMNKGIVQGYDEWQYQAEATHASQYADTLGLPLARTDASIPTFGKAMYDAGASEYALLACEYDWAVRSACPASQPALLTSPCLAAQSYTQDGLSLAHNLLTCPSPTHLPITYSLAHYLLTCLLWLCRGTQYLGSTSRSIAR